MIEILLILFCVFVVAKLINTASANSPKLQPAKAPCPPHSWSWEKVYNEDGSVHHQHIVCTKCGPLNGIQDEQ